MVLVLKKDAGKKQISAIRKKISAAPAPGVDTKKYCGTLRLKETPLTIQKKMRDEWE